MHGWSAQTSRNRRGGVLGVEARESDHKSRESMCDGADLSEHGAGAGGVAANVHREQQLKMKSRWF